MQSSLARNEEAHQEMQKIIGWISQTEQRLLDSAEIPLIAELVVDKASFR
jgi:hypothetical protein